MLAAIVDASEDAIASFSLDYRLTSWNTGAENLMGIAAQEVSAEKSMSSFSPRITYVSAHALDEVSQTGKPVASDCII